MTIELIPVIEIGYHNQGIKVPDDFPYWDFPELWDKYNADCYKKAGFKDDFRPYLAGSSFYRLSEISVDNLTKLIIDHTEEMRQGKYERDRASAFFGGYVLRINGQDKYFPQCCGDLSDIQYWAQLLKGQSEAFYHGHPAPQVEIKGNHISLDFTVGEFDEHFVPPLMENKIQFDLHALNLAIEVVKIELEEFSNRVKAINLQQNLGIDKIDDLLIWGDCTCQHLL